MAPDMSPIPPAAGVGGWFKQAPPLSPIVVLLLLLLLLVLVVSPPAPVRAEELCGNRLIDRSGSWAVG
jgi:hypothetical protein